MEFVIVLAIYLLIYYSISFHFSKKGFEAMREFDYEKDKEILEEVGIKNFNDIEREITEKVEDKKLWSSIFIIASFTISIAYMIGILIFELYSIKQVLMGATFVIVPSILVFWING